MAAVLKMQRLYLLLIRHVLFPVYRWVAILAVICHSGDVQISNWSFSQPFQHLLQNSHLRGIWCEISIVLYWLRLVVTLPARVPLATTAPRYCNETGPYTTNDKWKIKVLKWLIKQYCVTLNLILSLRHEVS